MTFLHSCSCSHAFQDSTYGKGIRVFNTTKASKSPDTITGRCTVCTATITAPKSSVKR